MNQAFAKKFFKDESAIGQHFGNIDMKYAGNFAIVGVTEDTTYRDPKKKANPMFFLPETQGVAYDDPRFVTFENRSHYLNAVELRTLGKVTGLEMQVRHALADVNQNLAVIDFMSFGAQVENNFNQQAMIAKLTSLAHERNRDPHGAGRGTDEYLETGPARGGGADGNCAGDRHSGDDCCGARDGVATIRN